MFKSFLISMFAILLFALGATGSWFYLNMDTDENTDEAAGQPIATSTATDAEASPFPKFRGTDLAAVIRGPDVDADEMVRLEIALASKREQARQYDEQLREQTQRIKVADTDTKLAQREVEGAAIQARKMVEAAERLLEQIRVASEELKAQMADLEGKTEALKAAEKEAGAGTVARTKDFAELMASMAPEAAANIIVGLANKGKMDFAIQLFRNMEHRNSSKILAEIPDNDLVTEIADQYLDHQLLR